MYRNPLNYFRNSSKFKIISKLKKIKFDCLKTPQGQRYIFKGGNKPTLVKVPQTTASQPPYHATVNQGSRAFFLRLTRMKQGLRTAKWYFMKLPKNWPTKARENEPKFCLQPWFLHFFISEILCTVKNDRVLKQLLFIWITSMNILCIRN